MNKLVVIVLIFLFLSSVASAEVVWTQDVIIASGVDVSVGNVKIGAYATGQVDIVWEDGFFGNCVYNNWVDGSGLSAKEWVHGNMNNYNDYYIMGVSRDSNTVRIGVNRGVTVSEFTRPSSGGAWDKSDTGVDALPDIGLCPTGGYDVDPTTGLGGFTFTDDTGTSGKFVYVRETKQNTWLKTVVNESAKYSRFSYSHLEYDANGNPLSVFVSKDPIDSRFKLFAGNPAGSTKVVAQTTYTSHSACTIGTDGTWHLLDGYDQPNYAVAYIKSTDNGATWTRVSKIVDYWVQKDGCNYEIAVAPDGSKIAALVYSDTDKLTLATSTDGGSTWDRQLLTGGVEQCADLDFDPAGNLYVSYYDSTNDQLHLMVSMTCQKTEVDARTVGEQQPSPDIKPWMLVRNVDDYGAVGDGKTDDTAAFYAAAKAIEDSGGGTLTLTGGKTYRVGKQVHIPGKYPYYQPEKMIEINGAAHKVTIQGNGATVKLNDGLRYGSFDKNTGEPLNIKSTDWDCLGNIGHVIDLRECVEVEINDVKLDGNMYNYILGGEWGDFGRQTRSMGIYLGRNHKVSVYNITANYFGLDGMAISWNGLDANTPPKPHYLENVECCYNGRQGLSWVGGNMLTVVNSKFNHTGKARIASLPKSGVDIEAEYSICRNGKFINCEFINNSTAGVVSDCGNNADCTFIGCTFWGTTGYAIWPKMPGFKFIDCNIYGAVVNVYGSDDPNKATQFTNCYFEDIQVKGFTTNTPTAIVHCHGENVKFEGCTIVANKTKAFYLWDTSDKEIIKNCDIYHKSNEALTGDFLSYLCGTYLENTRFYETLSDGSYYIAAGNPIVGPNVVVDGPKCAWVVPGGLTGAIPQVQFKDGFENDLSKWTNSVATKWNRTAEQKRSGGYSINCGDSDTNLVSNNIDMSNCTSIKIEFYYRYHIIDDNDNISLQLYDGRDYIDKFELNNGAQDTWNSGSIILDDNNDPNYFHPLFRIKFKWKPIDKNENLWIDDVTVYGY